MMLCSTCDVRAFVKSVHDQNVTGNIVSRNEEQLPTLLVRQDLILACSHSRIGVHQMMESVDAWPLSSPLTVPRCSFSSPV